MASALIISPATEALARRVIRGLAPPSGALRAIAPRVLISDGPERASFSEISAAILPLVTVDGTSLDFQKLRRGCDFAIFLFAEDASESSIEGMTRAALGAFGAERLTVILQPGSVSSESLLKSFQGIRVCEVRSTPEGASVVRLEPATG